MPRPDWLELTFRQVDFLTRPNHDFFHSSHGWHLAKNYRTFYLERLLSLDHEQCRDPCLVNALTRASISQSQFISTAESWKLTCQLITRQGNVLALYADYGCHRVENREKCQMGTRLSKPLRLVQRSKLATKPICDYSVGMHCCVGSRYHSSIL